MNLVPSRGPLRVSNLMLWVKRIPKFAKRVDIQEDHPFSAKTHFDLSRHVRIVGQALQCQPFPSMLPVGEFAVASDAEETTLCRQ